MTLVVSLVALVLSVVNFVLYFLKGNVDRRLQYQHVHSEAMLDLTNMAVALLSHVESLASDQSCDSCTARSTIIQAITGLTGLRERLRKMSAPKIGSSLVLPDLDQIRNDIKEMDPTVQDIGRSVAAGKSVQARRVAELLLDRIHGTERERTTPECRQKV
jgi:hypothetical protein